MVLLKVKIPSLEKRKKIAGKEFLLKKYRNKLYSKS